MAKIENELELENSISPNGGEDTSGGPRKRKTVLTIVVPVMLIIALIVGFRYWQFASAHSSTDDAYITSDVIEISPQVNGGKVDKVLVSDNQMVKKGQLLLTIDDSMPKAAVDQAKASLDVAIAQAKTAGVNISLQEKTGSAQIAAAEGSLGQARSGIGSARAIVMSNRAVVLSAVASQKKAHAAVTSAEAGVEGAKANLASANAAVNAAQANYDNAAREAKRFASLASAGADSQEKADQYATTAASAKAALDGAMEQVNAAKARVEASQADLSAAKEQAGAADAIVEQSKAQLAAAQVGVPQALAKQRQAQGDLLKANTAPVTVAMSRSDKARAEANVEQARAALKNALVQLGYCRIYAPADGRICKKAVEVGEILQAGAPVMAIVPSLSMWVVGNFKETQLEGIHMGSKAEVYVDAFPGQPFKGKVESLSAGTGSTFALLPPDNATGNFVKVVQRVPVKIVLDPNQPHLDELIAGTSVTAVVEKR